MTKNLFTLNLKIFSPLDLVMDSPADRIPSFTIRIFPRNFSINLYPSSHHSPILNVASQDFLLPGIVDMFIPA